mgnify:FL=1
MKEEKDNKLLSLLIAITIILGISIALNATLAIPIRDGQELVCETKIVSSNTLRCKNNECGFDEYPKKFCYIQDKEIMN